mmetsp:Transcript_2013/g.2872  ORF Transcript_2013/g.2872 Transcript_2013/m.2872 type:complete len:381 (-) Transcript_2013:209-1351(-)|eukprot:CAMPEP_0167753742 /NCGR_PEP_ID=MMETSP0110_2-20121227/7884_1 /TAXON_ID=629695 /ORGANISM="Gymnochlora sp., Strain CCMP2014" /LENGTH=380 /DNA_ID=CAMNT_0007639545 /DNA_START=36 /DNA_END=1178 /DNA_ORIENTATION=+
MSVSQPEMKEKADESKVSVFVKLHQQLNISRAAGIVALSSVPLGAEAVVIFISSNLQQPSGDLAGDSDTVFSPGLKYTASAFEAFVFVTGLFLAIASTMFNINIPSLTATAAAISLIFGTFYTCVIVIAEPIFNFDNELFPPLAPAGGWDTEFRKRAVFWVGQWLCGIFVALMAFGWQFSSIVNLYRCQTDLAANSKPFMNKVRYFVFSFFVFMIGIGIMTVAGWTRTQEGHRGLASPVVYAPTVIVWPDVAVMSGVFVIAYGVLNMLHALVMMNLDPTWTSNTVDLVCFLVSAFLKLLSVLAYCWLVGFHVMMQIGLASAGPAFAGVAAYYSLLLIPIVFAPIWYMTEAERVSNKESISRSVANLQKVENSSQVQLANV